MCHLQILMSYRNEISQIIVSFTYTYHIADSLLSQWRLEDM